MAEDGYIGVRPLVLGEARKAEEMVGRFGLGKAEEFAVRVGPVIFGGAGDIEGTRGEAGEELVLIDREGVFIFAVGDGGGTKPMGESFL